VSPTAAVFAVLLLILAIGWWELMPKPPALYMLSIDPSTASPGQQVTVKWQADPLSKVRLQIGSYQDILPADGEHTFPAPTPGADEDKAQVTVTAVAIRDGKESEPKTVQFEVVVPPKPEPPKVVSFKITPQPLTKGGTGIASYDFQGSVKKAWIEPIGLDLEVTGNSKTFPTPDVPAGTMVTFTLVVQGEDGTQHDKKIVKVKVIEQSLASIVKFDAFPLGLPAPGEVTLSWQLGNAARAEISNGEGAPMEVDPNKGTQVFPVAKTTTFTLTGIDEKGNKVTKSITVKVTPAPPPPDLDKDSVPPGAPPK
jgi:hypothetical protein